MCRTLVVFAILGNAFIMAELELPKTSIHDLKPPITTIMQSFYCEHMKVDLTTISNNKREIEDILDEILPMISQCATIRMSSKLSKKRSKKVFNLILLDDFEDFKSFVRNMLSKENFDYRGYYTIIFIHHSIDLKSLFNLAWNISLTNFNAVVKLNKTWEFFTYFPFSENICGNSNPFKVNLSMTFPNKITNLHQCPISFPKFSYYPGLIIEDGKSGMKVSGIDGDIMNELKGVLNFTMKVLQMRREEDRWGALYENGSSKGAVGMVINREVDLTLGFMVLTALRTKYMDATYSFTSWPFVLIVPPGAEVSSFQKLFRPFSVIVWCLLSFSFLCGFIFIFIIRRCNNAWLIKQIFGHVNHVSYLNMMNIFFGGTLHILPSNNVSRMLIATFILYCIVMRNLYQGSLFKFLQSDDRQRPVMTVDEMLEKKFTFYIYPVYHEHTKHLKFSKR